MAGISVLVLLLIWIVIFGQIDAQHCDKLPKPDDKITSSNVVKLCQTNEKNGDVVYLEAGGVQDLGISRCTCNVSMQTNSNNIFSVNVTAFLPDKGYLKLEIDGQSVNVSELATSNAFKYFQPMEIVLYRITWNDLVQCFKLNGVKMGKDNTEGTTTYSKLKVVCHPGGSMVAITRSTVTPSLPTSTSSSSNTSAARLTEPSSTPTSTSASSVVSETTMEEDNPTATVINQATTVNSPVTTVNNPTTTVNNPVTTVNNPVTTVKNQETTVNNPVTTVNNPTITVNNPTTTVNNPTTTVNNQTTTVNNPTTTVNNPLTDEGTTRSETDTAVKDKDSIDIGILAGSAGGGLVVVVIVVIVIAVVCKRRRHNKRPVGEYDSTSGTKDTHYDMTVNRNYVSADTCHRETTTPNEPTFAVTGPDAVTYSVVNKHSRQPQESESVSNSVVNKHSRPPQPSDAIMYSVVNKHSRRAPTSDAVTFSDLNKCSREPQPSETIAQSNDDDYNHLHEVTDKSKSDNVYDNAGASIAGMQKSNTDDNTDAGGNQPRNAQEHMNHSLDNKKTDSKSENEYNEVHEPSETELP